MDKDLFLQQIASMAYNIGFGAKKHFATFDIVTKVPGLIGIISVIVGIFALFVDYLSSKYISATFLVFGFSTLMINLYDEKKEKYEDIGKSLTALYNDLHTLYNKVKSSKEENFDDEIETLKKIEKEYYEKCITKHIVFSDWLAHYKFFWQHQIDWVDEQKHFRFWRDKIPLSFTFTCFLVLAAGTLIAINHFAF